jgi:hypothetical protein
MLSDFGMVKNILNNYGFSLFQKMYIHFVYKKVKQKQIISTDHRNLDHESLCF